MEEGRETSMQERIVRIIDWLPLLRSWTGMGTTEVCALTESNLPSFSLQKDSPTNSATPARARLIDFKWT